MQTNIETLGQLERRLHVTVPTSEIDGEIAKRLQKLAKTARISGFRPGKVPFKIIAQQYGPQIRSEVITETVQKSFSEAVSAQKLRVAGYPRFEPKANDTGQFEYSATFEVYPDVIVSELSETTIVKLVAEITDQDVDHTLEALRLQRATYSPVERAAELNDRATVDFSGTIDGIKFEGGQAQDFLIFIGEGRMLPEFETALLDMKAGEAKTFQLTFPSDYHGVEVAGKHAQFDLHVKQVAERILPALDEEFARSLGITDGSIDSLRKEVTANLQLELKRKLSKHLREQVMQALRQVSVLSVPRSLVEIESHKLLESAKADMAERGITGSELSSDLFMQTAEQRVASALILSEVVKQHQLQARLEQIRELVVEAAQSYEHPEEVINWHYQDAARLSDFEVVALENNVVEWALARAMVEERRVNFSELMENKQ